ncbi:aldolase/citrate lyase family protein [uncultured Shimia sp.]|uniref:HpcH/HpaI aldolase family protein n=1 Tax=uncultured Shimia sp. TaxID=573152 RepID=UPI00260AF192|nr:aldolase/citrate lyase family protein [uncultured Shimia sp.]
MRLKQKLQNTDMRLSSALCTIPSAAITQALAASGLDAVIVDLEHGAVDYGSAHAMIAATAGTDCAPLVRIRENIPSLVKRALDLGAEGIVFPLIRTAEEARLAVQSMHYPPDGVRGFGPFIAQSRWQANLASYPAQEQGNLICCLLVETAEAVDNIDAICAVEGIDLLIPAQFDLSTDLGIMGQFEHPEFQRAVAKVEAAANKASIPLGNAALAEPQALALFERGYRLVASFDILWLREKAAEMAGWCKS